MVTFSELGLWFFWNLWYFSHWIINSRHQYAKKHFAKLLLNIYLPKLTCRIINVHCIITFRLKMIFGHFSLQQTIPPEYWIFFPKILKIKNWFQMNKTTPSNGNWNASILWIGGDGCSCRIQHIYKWWVVHADGILFCAKAQYDLASILHATVLYTLVLRVFSDWKLRTEEYIMLRDLVCLGWINWRNGEMY